MTLTPLSLDNTPVNRLALGRELSEGFAVELGKLLERTTFVAPSWEKISAEYTRVAESITAVEEALGIELTCLEEQVAVEMALAGRI